jgi:hypothetical protein
LASPKKTRTTDKKREKQRQKNPDSSRRSLSLEHALRIAPPGARLGHRSHLLIFSVLFWQVKKGKVNKKRETKRKQERVFHLTESVWGALAQPAITQDSGAWRPANLSSVFFSSNPCSTLHLCPATFDHV